MCLNDISCSNKFAFICRLTVLTRDSALMKQVTTKTINAGTQASTTTTTKVPVTTTTTTTTTTQATTTTSTSTTKAPTTTSSSTTTTTAKVSAVLNSITSECQAAFRASALSQHNALRAKHGAQKMTQDSAIDSSALAYAEYLASTGEFEHSTTDYGENLYSQTFNSGITLDFCSSRIFLKIFKFIIKN